MFFKKEEKIIKNKFDFLDGSIKINDELAPAYINLKNSKYI